MAMLMKVLMAVGQSSACVVLIEQLTNYHKTHAAMSFSPGSAVFIWSGYCLQIGGLELLSLIVTLTPTVTAFFYFYSCSIDCLKCVFFYYYMK